MKTMPADKKTTRNPGIPVAGEFNLRYLLEVFFRRKRVFLLAFILTPILAVLISFLMKDEFISSTTILLGKEQILNPLVRYETAVAMVDTNRLSSFQKIIYSRPLLEDTIRKLNLDKALKDELAMEKKVEYLRKNIHLLGLSPDSFQIACTAAKPLLAKNMVETVSQLFIEKSLQGSRREALAAVKLIQQQVDYYRKEMERTESALQQFNQDNMEIIGQMNTLRSQLNDYRTRALEAEQDLPSQKHYQELQLKMGNLLATRQESHPEVIKLQREMDYTARLLENEGKQRVSKYERLREETRRKLARIPGLEKEQARMEGELKLVQELYNALSVKLEQARITSEVEIVQQANRFTIIEPPVVPLTRHKPNRPLFAAAGVAGGVCIGILLVFLLEFTEPRLMRTGELLRQTRLRLAGVLPKLYDYEEPRTFRLAFQPVVKGVRNLFCARRFILPPEIPVNLAAYKAFLNQLKPGESSEGEALADYIERLRSIAIRARDTYPDHDRLLWMVTSTRAGEGKSFLAANLGAVLASDLQKPVLLLDADFKTASLSKTLGCRNAPGMADILEQRASIDEAMISLPMPDLFLLPAGAVREDPEILYNSPACQRLLERLRERFCFILMESPEMLASSGGSLLAPHTDGVLFVTLLYKARRRAVEAAIQRLPAEKIIGVVFNYFEYWIPEWLYRWV